MFDFVSKHRQVVSVGLTVVGLGLLVGGGVSRYGLGEGGEPAVAHVDGTPITERAVAEVMENQKIPETAKPQVIQALVQQRQMLAEADDRHILASPSMMSDSIQAIPAFQKDGKFDLELYKTLLKTNHYTVERFEAKVADDLRAPLGGGLSNGLVGAAVSIGAFSSKLVNEHVVDLLSTSRDISTVNFTAAQYLSKVSVSDADIKQYYESHHGEFNVPERVKLDYIVLSRDELAAQIPVDDAKAQKYYDEHRAEIAPEERSVRHILVKVDEKAPASVRAAARKKAEDLLAEVKKNPASFADVAKKNSDDTGSAVQGGDLGYFSNNGTMVKPFADAAFKLNKGQISEIVESQFGFHILKLDDIRTKSFEQVKPVIVSKLQREKAIQDFQAQADKFKDSVFQQPDSLKPTADAFKLEIRHSDWVMRDKAADPMLNKEAVREAAFSSDVVAKHQNSDAIDLGNGTSFIALRAVDHQLPSIQPLAQVSTQISDKLKLERAKKLAQEDGAKALAALQKGEQGQYEWSAVASVNQFDHADLNKEALKAVFAAPIDKLPAYAGLQVDNGYQLVKVIATKPAAANPERARGMVKQLDRLAGEQQTDLFVKDVMARHKAK
jgi:peptidyl-prolyl cis-trans isomerase D